MKKIIAANWKMNLNFQEAKDLAKQISKISSNNELIIFPSSIYFLEIDNILSTSPIKVGAQNCSDKEIGAYTGEVAASQLKSINCEYVLVGHSERRQYFSESDEIINSKAKLALRNNIKPIICIGENLKERENGDFKIILENQISKCLDGINANEVIIAYEPVWAIGTGLTANLEQIKEAHNIILEKAGSNSKILYGGSVNENNYEEILGLENVAGVLVGGASLNYDKFSQICSFS